MCSVYFKLFFFKQKKADEMRIRDWRSDVCSADRSFLQSAFNSFATRSFPPAKQNSEKAAEPSPILAARSRITRSAERRVGKECVSTCRSRRSTYHSTKHMKTDNH